MDKESPTPDFAKPRKITRKSSKKSLQEQVPIPIPELKEEGERFQAPKEDAVSDTEEISPEQPIVHLEPQAGFSPISSTSSLTVSKLRPEDAPENLNDRIARLEKLHIHKKALLNAAEGYTVLKREPEEKEVAHAEISLSKVRDGSGFLPGEAESIVMNALLERTQRGKSGFPDTAKLGYIPAYRSLSPLSGSFISLANYSQGSLVEFQQSPDEVATREVADGPSSELQEYLRMKGFCFPESAKKKNVSADEMRRPLS